MYVLFAHSVALVAVCIIAVETKDDFFCGFEGFALCFCDLLVTFGFIIILYLRTPTCLLFYFPILKSIKKIKIKMLLDVGVRE